MRTFHTGGIAGEDITHGLPRVVELFEARTPKGAAVLARTSGVVRIAEEDNARRITIVSDDGTEDIYNVSVRAKLADGIRDGVEVMAGDALVDGPKDPKQLLEIKGIRETQQYLVDEVQHGLPGPGRVDPRQAHRADRAPDAAPGPGRRAGRVAVPAR